MRFSVNSEILHAHLKNDNLIDEVRLGALETLMERNELNVQQINVLLKDKSQGVRLKAFAALATLDNTKAQNHAAQVAINGSMAERQLAYSIMASSSINDKLLLDQLDKMSKGKGDRQVMLEVLNASKTKKTANFKEKLAAYDALVAKGTTTDKFSYAIEGGNIDRGRDVFFNHGAAQCLRCHKVKGLGADVGPDLTLMGKMYDRRYLLEAIVDPGAAVAPGCKNCQCYN